MEERQENRGDRTKRWAVIVSVVLAGAFIGLLVFVMLGSDARREGDERKNAISSQETTVGESEKSVETSPTTTTPAGEESPQDNGASDDDGPLSSAETRTADGRIRAMGFIGRVWVDGGVRYIEIDYAEMLTGEEANDAAVAAGEIAPGEEVPNDYFIRNINPMLRTFRVAETATITRWDFSSPSGIAETPITWDEFIGFWTGTDDASRMHRASPWWIERRGDLVEVLEEQYLP